MPQRGVVAVQPTDVGSRFLAMYDFSQCMMVTTTTTCDGGAAMVARVDAITSMVEGLSDTLSTSCELIWVFNALWQGAGSGGHTHFSRAGHNYLYHSEWYGAKWRVIDLQYKSGGPALARLQSDGGGRTHLV